MRSSVYDAVGQRWITNRRTVGHRKDELRWTVMELSVQAHSNEGAW